MIKEYKNLKPRDTFIYKIGISAPHWVTVLK